MLKANELRVGNIVSITGIQFVLNTQNLAYILEQDGIDTRCEPIPLTPEIFERFGFTSKGKYFTNGILTLYPYGNGSYGIEVDGFTDQGINTSVSYLHELQNIYFCLRGEELKIKQDINTIDFGNGFVVGL
jgi:hypothetical protein